MLWHGKLDPRLRELVIMRIGWLTASDYEWTQHWRVAQGLRRQCPASDKRGSSFRWWVRWCLRR
jgi:hypothetical protein